MFSLFDNAITDFIKQHTTAVIATVNEHGQPSTSTIYYVAIRNNVLHFITKTETTKFQNLSNNNRAALTIVDKDQPIELSMEGTVQEVVGGELHDEIMQTVLEHSYASLGDYAPIVKLHRGSFSVMEFLPTKAKLTDFTKPIGKVNEQKREF